MSTRSIQATDPARLASSWLEAANAALNTGDVAALSGLVTADGWWRDQLALTDDLRTAHGEEAVRGFLRHHASRAGLRDLGLTDTAPVVDDTGLVQAFFSFATHRGRGEGVLRLRADDDGNWRAWTVLTALRELVGHEPRTGHRRPPGTVHGSQRDAQTWPEVRARGVAYADREPQVVVVGAGQSGLALAARLRLLDVDALVVDAHPRVGDAWRTRYRSLVLHDPVWYDHMPYMPFPPGWPVYTPKDKLADWMESYAETMELNVWTSTTLVGGSYDDATECWSVVVRRDGDTRELRPQHLVLATGLQSEKRLPRFPGLDGFAGEVLHSSAYREGSGRRGQRAVVIGAGNSGHDIAHDLHLSGAQVTMVQRSGTAVVSSENGIAALFGGLYHEDGPPTEEADLLFASLPYDLLAQLHVGLTAQLREDDADLLAGLEAVGFRLDYGEDASGLFMMVLRKAGGYYIDVGASGLIASGEIALAAGVGVQELTEDGVQLTDGRHLPADVVVLATGYETIRETARRLLGEDEASRCGPVWGLDDEGEVRGVWRPTGHPGLWFMGGNLHLARYYSQVLALQLQLRLVDRV